MRLQPPQKADYIRAITRASSIWQEADREAGGKWTIVSGTDEDGDFQYRESAAGMILSLYPDDYSRSDLLELIDREIIEISNGQLAIRWLRCRRRNFTDGIRDKYWDFQKKFGLGDFAPNRPNREES